MAAAPRGLGRLQAQPCPAMPRPVRQAGLRPGRRPGRLAASQSSSHNPKGGREWLQTLLSRFGPMTERASNTAVLDFEKPLVELDNRIKEARPPRSVQGPWAALAAPAVSLPLLTWGCCTHLCLLPPGAGMDAMHLLLEPGRCLRSGAGALLARAATTVARRQPSGAGPAGRRGERRGRHWADRRARGARSPGDPCRLHLDRHGQPGQAVGNAPGACCKQGSAQGSPGRVAAADRLHTQSAAGQASSLQSAAPARQEVTSKHSSMLSQAHSQGRP